ncbi:ABC transporter ATP-binding protein [Prauserella endophytica]|uniref:ABC transporter ATP-binding protein n=2 Tax=Prauserella endophytica TaxID=1592324 RepID=A0ABY2RZH9_9PSEU|nr:ABC transporter ATP-binding protein [Prauserella endophytica]
MRRASELEYRQRTAKRPGSGSLTFAEWRSGGVTGHIMATQTSPTLNPVECEPASSAVQPNNDLLVAEHVTVDYTSRGRRVRALDDVTLRIAPGEAVGLIGESGSGKTTLSRALLGLVKPTRGNVRYRGRDIYSLKVAQRHRLLGGDTALIFQDPRSSLNPRLSVGAVIRDPLQVRHIGSRHDREVRVNALLHDVGLPTELIDRPVRELSGGQLQRVAIARALAVEPSLVIADEPTSALDVSIQAQILNLLNNLKRSRGIALLVVSHDIRAIRFLCDRTAVMNQGSIVESSTTDSIFTCPKDAYTRQLLDAAPRLNYKHGTDAKKFL